MVLFYRHIKAPARDLIYCKEINIVKILSDAAVSEPVTELRELFTIFLIFCQPFDPFELWSKFHNDLCEDILNRIRNDNQDITLEYQDIYNEGHND